MPDYTDTYDDDVEDDSQDTNPMKQLRAANRKQAKDLKDSQAELAELRAFRAEAQAAAKVAEAGKVFTDLGLSAKQAALFLKVSDAEAEVTRDAVIAFAKEYEIADLAGSTEDADTSEEESTNFVPVTTGGTSPVKRTINREQFEALKRTDMAAAVKAVQDGRVEGFQAKLDGDSAVTFG